MLFRSEFLIGVLGKNSAKVDSLIEVDDLFTVAKKQVQFVFGHFSYGLKDQIESLQSSHVDSFNWPLMHFFIPDQVIRISGSEIIIESESEQECDVIFQKLSVDVSLTNTFNQLNEPIEVLPSVSRKGII